MTGNPDDAVLRLLDEAGLADDPVLAGLLGELTATRAAEAPVPSRDVTRLMSGRRPVGSSWFARRGTRMTTVVLLAAALAGGASAAAAASPAFHSVVGDAFSGLAKLVGPPAHPKPAVPGGPVPEQDTAKDGQKPGQHALGAPGPQGSQPDAETPGTGLAQGSQVSQPSLSATDDGDAQQSHDAASGASLSGKGGHAGGGTSGDGAGAGNAGAGSGGQGEDDAGTAQKPTPTHLKTGPSPVQSPISPTGGSESSSGGSSGSGGQDSGR